MIRKDDFSRLEINLAGCLDNYKYFRSRLEASTKLLVLVKANAYGHGAVEFASLMEEARRAEADLYITADLKYNDFMTPDGAFVVADVGHFESEYCAIDILFDVLSKKMFTFAVRKSEHSCNPIHYLV